MNDYSEEYPDDPHLLAVVLDNAYGIAGVRSEPDRVTIAYAPEERHVNKLPEEVYSQIKHTIKHSSWEAEYNDYDRGTVEKHSWSGGLSNSPLVPPHEQPAGYELQFSLVK